MRLSSDTIVAVALLVFAALLWFWLIPGFAGTGDDRVLPRALAIVIAGLAAILLVTSSRRAAAARGFAGEDEDPFLERDTHGEPPLLLLLALVWGLDAFLMRWFGYYPMSFLAVAASLLVLGMRRWHMILIWSIAPLVVVYIVFEQGFALTLPRGRLIAPLFG